jgi:hypothetical protein
MRELQGYSDRMTPMFPSASDYAEAVKVEVSLVSVKHSTIALGASATTHIGKLVCASVNFFQTWASRIQGLSDHRNQA